MGQAVTNATIATSGVPGKALATSLGINGGVCIAAMLLFAVLRVHKFTRKFYMPKRFDHEVVRKPRALPNGLFSWMKPVLTYPEDDVMLVAGLDVVVMTRLLTYGWLLFCFCTVWCCIVLMPINATAGALQGSKDIDILTASNVAVGDNRFWAHLISGYVVSAVALVLLLGFSKDMSRLRARYMSLQRSGITSRTVLVTDIPCVDGVGLKPPAAVKLASKTFKATSQSIEAIDQEGGKGPISAIPGAEGYPPLSDEALDPWESARRQLKRGDADAMVRQEMESTYGAHNLAAVHVVPDTRKVDGLLAKYNATKSQLEDLTDDYIGKIKRKEAVKRKQVSLLPGIAPKWAKDAYNITTKTVKVDALEYLPRQLDQQLQELQTEKDNIKGACLPAAFVTFSNHTTANAAASGLHSYDEAAWRVQPAPGSEEIIWPNLSMRHLSRVARRLAMLAAFVALLVWYLPVCAAIQAVVNLNNVRSVPGLGLITQLPFVTQVLQGILPSLVLTIFLILLPPILAVMARFEGEVSDSQIDFSVVSRFFVFQVFALFLYNFILGSAFGKIKEIIADPTGQMIRILGETAPMTASFFMSFIMMTSLGVGMGLLRPVPLVLYFIFSRLAGTERARYRLWAKQPFRFGTNVATHTMIILLGLAFTCLSPLIAPFSLLYFSLALLAQKYQLLYVVTLPYDAAGRMWKNCFHQIMVGIYFLQLILLCVLLVKKFLFALLVLPLLVFTLIFHVVVMGLFKRPWSLMNTREAALLDQCAMECSAAAGGDDAAVQLTYKSPAFKIDENAHRKLVQEAAQVDKHLKGEPSELQLEEGEASSVSDDAY